MARRPLNPEGGEAVVATTRVTTATATKIDAIAEATDRRRSDVLRDAIEAGLPLLEGAA
jgi:predicted transcriptional regulator